MTYKVERRFTGCLRRILKSLCDIHTNYMNLVRVVSVNIKCNVHQVIDLIYCDQLCTSKRESCIPNPIVNIEKRKIPDAYYTSLSLLFSITRLQLFLFKHYYTCLYYIILSIYCTQYNTII